MKVVHLVPGSGGTFYCQNCVRDRGLVRALRRAGHDVMLAPLYLPMFGETHEPAANAPLFFGGISAYLREQAPFLRRMPAWLARLLDARWLLKLAARREGSTNAADLGPMTLSMLQGRNGNQVQELKRLVDWLKECETPEIVHISNALLLGLAPEIKRALGVRTVCTLQDEEPWVDAMRPPHDRLCWTEMAQNAAYVDHFVATSSWYATRMIDRLGLDPDRVTVLFPGVEPDEPAPGGLPFEPPVIGYLSRLNPAQGLAALVDAYLELRREPALARLRLTATGGYTPNDRSFLDGLRARLRAAGAADDVSFVEDFDEARRRDFLRSLTVLSVPAPEGEAFGLQLLEAMACGVPVVQPAVGAYPEILAATGGGLVYDPAEPGALVKALRALLTRPGQARSLGAQGRAAVLERFTNEAAAMAMADLYARVLGEAKP